MATRDNAMVTCSCGARWGDRRRAEGYEELRDFEHAMVASKILVFLKHWRMKHRITGHGGAEFRAIIEKAAAGIANEGEPT